MTSSTHISRQTTQHVTHPVTAGVIPGDAGQVADKGPDVGGGQGIVLVTVVTRSEWDANHRAVLSAIHTKLEDQARQRGLVLTADPVEDVEVLPHDTRVRITVRAALTPRQRL